MIGSDNEDQMKATLSETKSSPETRMLMVHPTGGLSLPRGAHIGSALDVGTRCVVETDGSAQALTGPA